MGPEIFSVWCGCGIEFQETTTWTIPCIKDWEKDFAKAKFSPEHELFLKTREFTEKLIARGKGKFIVGLTDLNPGADHIAALRDTENLALDLIENTAYVKKKLAESYQEFFKAYDIFYELIKEAEMPISGWTPLISQNRFNVVQCDFSALISNDMFEEIFLPGLIAECEYFSRTIYHLDGPDALRHLDSILSISALDAVQFVPGAGNEGFARWVEVYQKIQQAGKSLQMNSISLDELSLVFESLEPAGVWFNNIGGGMKNFDSEITSEDIAEEVIARIANWQ